MAPVAIIVGVWLIYNRVGKAAFASLGTLLFLMLATSINGLLVGKARRKIAAYADRRIKTLEETINSILVVKMYCWESFFLKKIIDSRKRFYISKVLRQENCGEQI